MENNQPVNVFDRMIIVYNNTESQTDIIGHNTRILWSTVVKLATHLAWNWQTAYYLSSARSYGHFHTEIILI